MMIKEAGSLTAKFDYVFHEGGMVAIVDVRKAGNGHYLLWWVAGITTAKRLAMAFQAQFALDVATPNDADAKVADLAPAIFAIAQESLLAGGVKPVPLLDKPGLPKDLASTFFKYFEAEKLLETKGLELNVSTGLQYEFCQLLNVSKPVEFMAEYLNLPVTTVRQRITWARNKGVLPKMRSQGVKLDA